MIEHANSKVICENLFEVEDVTVIYIYFVTDPNVITVFSKYLRSHSHC